MSDPRRMIAEIFHNPDICEDGEMANDLLREFHRGYPLENLRPLLASHNWKVVDVGIFIASELGAKAAPLLRDIAPLLKHPWPIIRFYVIDSLLTCSTGDDCAEVAGVMALLEDPTGPVRRKALSFLSRASDAQLHGALKYFEKTSPKSPQVAGLRWILGEDSKDAQKVISVVAGDDSMQKKYGVAAAARLAYTDRTALLQAATTADEDVSEFAANELRLLDIRLRNMNRKKGGKKEGGDN